jgi:alcohol dehydrogenase
MGSNAAACSTASAPGSIIVIGAGPIGLAALLTSQVYSPAEIIVVDI